MVKNPWGQKAIPSIGVVQKTAKSRRLCRKQHNSVWIFCIEGICLIPSWIAQILDYILWMKFQCTPLGVQIFSIQGGHSDFTSTMLRAYVRIPVSADSPVYY